MTSYEYAVVPAPKTGTKARGVKTTQDRFALAIQTIMNEYGAAGWEYLRTDTLPCEERQGFTGRTTTFQNMLVFRKTIVAAQTATPPVAAAVATTASPVETPQARVASTLTPPAPTATASPLVASRPLDVDPDRPEPRVAAE